MAGSSPELELAVSAKAAALIEDARAARPDWHPPPYDPRVLAHILGIPVVADRGLTFCDAMLITNEDGGFVIHYADRVESGGRRHFSVAHEIAHTFFEGADSARRFRQVDDGGEPDAAERALERLCDYGAAALLMPETCFRVSMAELGLHARSVPRLAKRYAVSLQAAALRIVQLHEGPIGAGIFAWGPRPSDPRTRRAYRLERMFVSRDFPAFLPRGRSVPPRSVIVRAASAEGELIARERVGVEPRSVTMTVMACAIRRPQSEQRHPRVCALFLPDSGAPPR